VSPVAYYGSISHTGFPFSLTRRFSSRLGLEDLLPPNLTDLDLTVRVGFFCPDLKFLHIDGVEGEHIVVVRNDDADAGQLGDAHGLFDRKVARRTVSVTRGVAAIDWQEGDVHGLRSKAFGESRVGNTVTGVVQCHATHVDDEAHVRVADARDEVQCLMGCRLRDNLDPMHRQRLVHVWKNWV